MQLISLEPVLQTRLYAILQKKNFQKPSWVLFQVEFENWLLICSHLVESQKIKFWACYI